jgi:predicted nucleic acid-binding protein
VSYLIDTNVLSELRLKQPDKHVVAWFANRAAQSLFLSVLSLGEIRKGLQLLDESHADGARRQSLGDWLEQELTTFSLVDCSALTLMLPISGDACKHLQVVRYLPYSVCLQPQPYITT